MIKVKLNNDLKVKFHGHFDTWRILLHFIHTMTFKNAMFLSKTNLTCDVCKRVTIVTTNNELI